MSGTEYEELMDTIRRTAARIFEYAETEEEVTKDNKDGKKKRTAQAYRIVEDPTLYFDYAEASIS